MSADVYRSWQTTSVGPVSFDTIHSAIFSPTIASGSKVSAVDRSNGSTFTRAPPGSFLEFTTDLVGVVSGFPGPVLFQWTWIDTFNGTSGGIGVLSNDLPVDP
ncbi:MAG TPA: hypothetical protein VHT21_06300, partial [Stellaceae bacterium]|nr:hypothetical protein [Stellaceae bacterium]